MESQTLLTGKHRHNVLSFVVLAKTGATPASALLVPLSAEGSRVEYKKKDQLPRLSERVPPS